MFKKKPQPPQPHRIRTIRGSFSWIDHRFFRQGFDQGLTRTEKLLYLVLVAVSNCDGVSFYSDERLGEFLDIHHQHEFTGARDELVGRDLIAFKDGVYQVLDLPARPSSRYEFGSNRLTVSEGSSSERYALVRHAHSDVVPSAEDFSIRFAADQSLHSRRQGGE